MTCKLHIVGGNGRLARTAIRCDCGWEDVCVSGHEWNSWSFHVLFDTNDLSPLDAAIKSGEVIRASL